jgi:hypothetical protein
MLVKYCLPAVALTAILAGCGAPRWKEFDQIQLGRTLPMTLPGQMERTILGAGYIGAPGGAGSFFGSDLRIASALTDPNDSVTAKSCLTVAIAHRLLYVQTTYRYAMEVDLGDIADADRKVPKELKLVALVSQNVAVKPADARTASRGDSEHLIPIASSTIARCLSLMEEAVFETRWTPDSSDFGLADDRRFTSSSVRFSKAMNQSLSVRMAGKQIETRLAMLPGSAGGTSGPVFIPQSLPEAMLYNHILLNTLTRPSKADHSAQTAEVHAMYVQYAHERMLEVLGDWKTYRGAETGDFDKKSRTLDGMTTHIKRIGNRLSVEVTGLIVRDSIMTDVDMGDSRRGAREVGDF